MNAISLSEKLMYSTVKINTDKGSGTGFFFSIDLNNKSYPILITNKHVIDYDENKLVNINFHLDTGNGTSTNNIIIPLLNNKWFFHPDKDLCFCFINPYNELLKRTRSKGIFITTIDKGYIYSKQQLENLSAIEEITMIGYPIGLSDEKNNFPIFRKGYTASHPAFSFNENGIGLADIATFPGSSGSPICLLNEISYSTKDGTVNIGSRFVLLGILFAGPQINVDGKFEIKNIPMTQQKISVQTPMMTNLGYYICAYEILEFESMIKNMIDEGKIS